MAQTDAVLLGLYQDAAAAIALGQSYEIAGRSLTRANLREVREMIDWLEIRIERAGDTTGGVGLISMGDAQ